MCKLNSQQQQTKQQTFAESKLKTLEKYADFQRIMATYSKKSTQSVLHILWKKTRKNQTNWLEMELMEEHFIVTISIITTTTMAMQIIINAKRPGAESVLIA